MALVFFTLLIGIEKSHIDMQAGEGCSPLHFLTNYHLDQNLWSEVYFSTRLHNSVFSLWTHSLKISEEWKTENLCSANTSETEKQNINKAIEIIKKLF